MGTSGLDGGCGGGRKALLAVRETGIGVVAGGGSAALALGLNQEARAQSVEGGEMLEEFLAARDVHVRKRWIGYWTALSAALFGYGQVRATRFAKRSPFHPFMTGLVPSRCQNGARSPSAASSSQRWGYNVHSNLALLDYGSAHCLRHAERGPVRHLGSGGEPMGLSIISTVILPILLATRLSIGGSTTRR